MFFHNKSIKIGRCPLCNRRITSLNIERMRFLLDGINKENTLRKKVENFPNYIEIISEKTILWTIYQEMNKKFSAPSDMEKRIKRVITINNFDEMVSCDVQTIIKNYVEEVLNYIEKFPEDPISQSYKKRALYFDIHRYTDNENKKEYNIFPKDLEENEMW